MFVWEDPVDDGEQSPSAGIQVQVTARAGTDAEFAELARSWLVGARANLATELSRRLDDGVSTVVGTVLRAGVPSFGVFQWVAEYSPENFEILLGSLEQHRGEDAGWMIDDMANVDPEVCSSAECGLHTDESWDLRVVFEASAWFGQAVVPLRAQEAFVDFVSEFAERARASFGNVTDDNENRRIALEVVLPRLEDHGVLQSDEVLRGYSWVTICPPGIVDRLGGYAALEATGAFVEVRRLDYGAALLRATERIEQYDDEAILSVFQALAPALPRGKPRQLPDFDDRVPPRLVYEDPADY